MTEWDGRERFSRVIEYIESNLFGELTLESVAASACLSVYHFHRMFQALFGDPVMEYIRNRRLDAGASLLTETDEKILEIALRCRFESHEAFIRAFRRRYGMTPGAFRKRAPVFARYPAAALKTRLDGADRPAGLDEPYLERRDEFEVAGIEGEVRFYGYRVAVEAIRLWRRFFRELRGLSGIVPGRLYGIGRSAAVGRLEEGGSYLYMACAEVTPDRTLPDGFSVRTIPAALYAVFRYAGPVRTVRDVHAWIYRSWLPASGYRPVHDFAFERFPAANRRDGAETFLEVCLPVESGPVPCRS
jgi:AraC family transcriptional regulator